MGGILDLIHWINVIGKNKIELILKREVRFTLIYPNFHLLIRLQ